MKTSVTFHELDPKKKYVLEFNPMVDEETFRAVTEAFKNYQTSDHRIVFINGLDVEVKEIKDEAA